MIKNQWYVILDSKEIKKINHLGLHDLERKWFCGEQERMRFVVLWINVVTEV
jgi:hypothetical protein